MNFGVERERERERERGPASPISIFSRELTSYPLRYEPLNQSGTYPALFSTPPTHPTPPNTFPETVPRLHWANFPFDQLSSRIDYGVWMRTVAGQAAARQGGLRGVGVGVGGAPALSRMQKKELKCALCVARLFLGQGVSPIWK